MCDNYLFVNRVWAVVWLRQSVVGFSLQTL